MNDESTMAVHLRFGPYDVDVGRRRLRCNGADVALEPQVFDVLVYLATSHDRVVTRDELLDAVWGHRHVSAAAVTSRIRDLRAALGDTGRDQAVIRTVRGRGFQFVAELVEATQPNSPGDPERRAERSESPATAGVPVRPPATATIGRSDDVADLHRAVESQPLVTLVGPGGIGKTHLARVALAGDDRSPAWFCDLATVNDPALLPVACLDAIGALPTAGLDPLDALLVALDGWECTLLMDNCEHLADAAAEMIGAIIEARPRVRVVATSRQPLRLRSEHVIRVGGLSPETSSELFTARAAAHGVVLDPSDAGVARVCAELDGLPLALELAASKTRALSLDVLVDQLGGRFDLLTSDARDEQRHHRSLGATIAWSFDLLGSAQRDALASMSVFGGPFDLDAARSTAGSSDESGGNLVDAVTLLELVDQSLLEFDPATGRYRLLDSIRAFADQELADRPGARRRHLDHHLQLVERAAGSSVAAGIDPAFQSMRAAWVEIRSAVGHALEIGEIDIAARIVVAVADYAEMSYSFEVADWAERVLAHDVGPSHRGTLAAVRSVLLSHRGEYDHSATALADAVADATGDRARVDLARFWLAYFTGDTDTAESIVTDLLGTYRGRDDYVEALSLTLEHYLAKGAGREVSADVVRRVESFADRAGEIGEIARGLCGTIRLDWDRHGDTALAELAELIGRGRRLNYRLLVGGASTARSIILGSTMDVDVGVGALLGTFRTYADDRMWSFAVADLGVAALALVRGGDAEHGARLLGARVASGYRGDVSEVLAETAERELRAELADRFDELVDDGTVLSPRAATHLAIDRLERLHAAPSS